MSYNEPPNYGTPPPPPAGGYGTGGFAGGDHPQGTTILILGILGLVCCGPLGIAAWVMGNKAIQEIDANPSAYTNRGTINAGRICGMIASILMVVGIVVYGIIFVVALGNS
ncbi:DUF4190 domain-containing protein [Nocardioides carbamazepini]|uniref:DUF4190 domain-containing protein n=1 Tax=Nocardioides carbamazepini TaxID=2854259 RepID=UPI00214A0D0D|nr:DUF4190 domain-containing protein [Nocardioides carbamazepini]MCR1781582.1 DUF4190 domain-containing protein [Nocardioides carbamazepini]